MSLQEPVTPVDGMDAYPGPSRRRGPSGGAVLLSLGAAALAGVVVGAVIGLGGGDEPGGSGAQPTASAEVDGVIIEPADVSSFDPVGGSGFRDAGDGSWRTQTYTTPAFGGLKAGAGLLVDLGEARAVSTVTLESATPGLTVELLGGDEPPGGDVEQMTAGEAATTDDGPTSLSGADAGSHRYWLVWVTELAPSGDGFAAQLSTPVVEGPSTAGPPP